MAGMSQELRRMQKLGLEALESALSVCIGS